jgi:hypothetical protein
MTFNIPPGRGYLGDSPTISTNEVMVIDDEAHRIHKVTVHQFTVGDAEDPDLYAGEPLWKWQQSENGKWVMDNAIETPEWHRMIDHLTYGYKYAITAKLKERDYMLWVLKFK